MGKKNKNKNICIPIEEQLLLDDRISSKMIELYNLACKDFNNNLINNPIYILDNYNQCKLFYIKYINNIMIMCNNDITLDENKINNLLNNNYTTYMSYILNINKYDIK